MWLVCQGRGVMVVSGEGGMARGGCLPRGPQDMTKREQKSEGSRPWKEDRAILGP